MFLRVSLPVLTLLLPVAATQGESNTGIVSAGGDARQYRCALQSLVADWRQQWHAGTGGASDASFPFGWFQLNACNRAVWEVRNSMFPCFVLTMIFN